MLRKAFLFCAVFSFLPGAGAVGVELETPPVGGGALPGGGQRGDGVRQQRLESDARRIQRAHRQLSRLAGKKAPEHLAGSVREKWEEQSKWLQRRAERLEELADELGRHARGIGPRARMDRFDYEQLKSQLRRVIDDLRYEVKRYEVDGEAAARRQEQAARVIAAAG